MRLFIILYLMMNSLSSFSQETDSLNSKQKFEFETFRNGKVKRLKKGRNVEVTLLKNDTTHVQSGNLIELNDSFLILDMSYEDISVSKENSSSWANFFYDTPNHIYIPVNSIDFLSYESRILLTLQVIGGISIITAGIIAPLVSIDKNEPYKFNSKKYVMIIKPALIGSAIGLTFGSNTMMRLKLPSKSWAR